MAGYLRFESLKESHIPAMLEIEKANNTSPWSERSFRNELEHEHGIVRVALLDDQVIGFGAVWLVIDEAHVTNLSIAESQKRKGYGRRLVTELLKEAVRRGMTCSTLEVRAGNAPAISLYESLGFRVVARRKGYYPDNKEDALVMWLYDLKADAL